MNLFKSTLAIAASVATLGFSSPVMANGIIGGTSRMDGGRLSVQTQRGTNCNSSAPDRANLSVVAGTRSNDYSGGHYSVADNNEFVGGVALVIPFGGPDLGNCSNLLELEEARARLDMATTLFEAGALSTEELTEVAASVRKIIYRQQAE